MVWIGSVWDWLIRRPVQRYFGCKLLKFPEPSNVSIGHTQVKPLKTKPHSKSAATTGILTHTHLPTYLNLPNPIQAYPSQPNQPSQGHSDLYAIKHAHAALYRLPKFFDPIPTLANS